MRMDVGEWGAGGGSKLSCYLLDERFPFPSAQKWIRRRNAEGRRIDGEQRKKIAFLACRVCPMMDSLSDLQMR